MTGRRTRVLVTPFMLAIYSLLAVLCVGWQLPAFGKSPVHNGLEVIHLAEKWPSLGAQQTSVPDTEGNRPSAESREKSAKNLGISPDKSQSKFGKIVLTNSWAGLHPIASSSSLIRDRLSASHVLLRWYRTVVLII